MASMKYRLDGNGGSGLVRVLLVITLLATVAAVCAIVATIVIANRDPRPADSSKDTDPLFAAINRLKERLDATVILGTKERPDTTVIPVTEANDDMPCLTQDCILTASEIIQAVDHSVNPCEDFELFACGSYIERPIPDDQPSNTPFRDLRMKTASQLRDILQESSNSNEMESLSRAKAVYKSCMDTDGMDAYGVTPLIHLLDELNLDLEPANPMFDFDDMNLNLESVIAMLSTHGLASFFETFIWDDTRNSSNRLIGLYEARLLMGSRDNYLTNGTELDLFREYTVSLMTALNYTQSEAEDFCKRVVDFEIALAHVTTPRDDDTPVPQRVKLFRLSDLSKNMTDQFDWLRFFSQILKSAGIASNADENEEFAFYYPAYFMRLFPLLNQTSTRTLHDYLMFRVINFAAGRLSEGFRKIESAYYNKQTGRPVSPPRWNTCVDETKNFLTDAIANAYVKRHFQSESKESVLATVKDLRTAFGRIIDEATWMDNTTKSYAREKLEVINSKIGYPDRILNETAVNLKYKDYVMNSTRFFENIVKGNKLNSVGALRKYTESRDADDGFSMPAFVVNAFFYPRLNNIVFPAAFLQPPYFSVRYPRSMNYGSIGSVIGHELTHGFDDDGRQYDKDGTDRDWWSESSKRNFEERARCISEQYSSYTIQGIHVNGNITLGEDIADNGALKQAYMAYQLTVARHGIERPLPGVPYTHDQLFFISYAAGYCSKSRPQYAKYLVTQDTHSPDRFRLLGTLQNSEEFADVFQCRLGTFMNPEEKCSVW